MNALTITNTTNAVCTSENVRRYVTQFNTFFNKSAEAVLEMGRVVYQASASLVKAEIIEFCGAVRLNHDGAAISKLKTIGKRYDHLAEHKEVLPNAWTTLYYLARMNEDQFEYGLQHQLIHQTMTANELKSMDPTLIKGKKQSTNSEVPMIEENAESNDLRIIVGDLFDAQQKVALIAMLEDVCEQFGVQLRAE